MRKVAFLVVATTAVLLLFQACDDSKPVQQQADPALVGRWLCQSESGLALTFLGGGTLLEEREYVLYSGFFIYDLSSKSFSFTDRFHLHRGRVTMYDTSSIPGYEDAGLGMLAVMESCDELYVQGVLLSPCWRDWRCQSYPVLIEGEGVVMQTSGSSWHFGSFAVDELGATLELRYFWEQDGDVLRFRRQGSPQEMPFTHFELDDDTLSLAWDGEWLTFRRK